MGQCIFYAYEAEYVSLYDFKIELRMQNIGPLLSVIHSFTLAFPQQAERVGIRGKRPHLQKQPLDPYVQRLCIKVSQRWDNAMEQIAPWVVPLSTSIAEVCFLDARRARIVLICRVQGLSLCTGAMRLTQVLRST